MIIVVYGQILDVCEKENCQWTSPNNDRILVCLGTANKCEVWCNTGGNNGYCQGLIIYNLSPSLYIQCDQTNSCRHMTVMC